MPHFQDSKPRLWLLRFGLKVLVLAQANLPSNFDVNGSEQ